MGNPKELHVLNNHFAHEYGNDNERARREMLVEQLLLTPREQLRPDAGVIAEAREFLAPTCAFCMRRFGKQHVRQLREYC